MSRIDEALRASGWKGATDVPRRPHDTDPFVSPWDDRSRPQEPGEGPEPTSLGRTKLLGDTSDSLKQTSFNPEYAERLALPSNPNQSLIERFRRLAGMLHHAQMASGIKVVLITSAAPGDGKTLTAMNLALTLSESYGRSALLIDTDLRRPSTHRLAQFDEISGLAEGLSSPAEQKLSVVRVTKSLTLLPAGRPLADPTRLLTSERMRRVVQEASERFDWVILDAPPIGPVTDASLLLELCDTALLVVRAGKSRHALVQKAVETLGPERIFGVVLNATDQTRSRSDDVYYGSYLPHSPKDR